MKKPLLSEMTLREKIGQTILPYQYDINRKTEVDASILRTKEEKAAFLRERQFGTLWVQPGAGSRGFDISWEAEHQDESEEFRQWILEDHKEWRSNVYGQCKSWLDLGLQPRAVSRDLDWGVPVPVEGDPVMEEMAEINIAALREENEDVLGWIRIPDTKIDYPLLQSEDNDFYLKHTWQKQRNSVGSIFLEHLNRPDLTDFNTIVYGHNMRDKSMFGQLDNYSIEGFWETHPYVYIAIDSGVYRYEVFAFLQAPVDSVTYSIRPQRDDTKQEFIDYSMEHTWIDTGVRPVITDRILTLSTCTGRDYSARNVVQARLPMMEVTE